MRVNQFSLEVEKLESKTAGRAGKKRPVKKAERSGKE